MAFKKLVILYILFTASLAAQVDTALTITEVMFNAPAGNNQYVEIFNLSYSDTFDLSKYRIQYSNTTMDYIVSAGYGTMLLPRQYAVIFQKNYDLIYGLGIYKNVIPETALIVKIYDEQFGNSGMISTATRPVSLLDENKRLIDTYSYSPDQTTAGISDEKILLTKDNSAGNWANSSDTLGTPGGRNSVTPVLLDVSVSPRLDQPLPVFSDMPVTFSFLVANEGKQEATPVSLNIYHDENFDSLGQPGELVYAKQNISLPQSKSLTINWQSPPLKAGKHLFWVTADLLHDEIPTNNAAGVWVTVYNREHAFNDIVFNEIMYAPVDSQPEWVELYNRTNAAIDLKRWRFADAKDTVRMPGESILFPAKSYLLLAKDTTLWKYYHYSVTPPMVWVHDLPRLNNDGDTIHIIDSLGMMIDSVAYTSTLGGANGHSLERVDVDAGSGAAANWKQSTGSHHATPGQINSVTPKEYDLALTALLFSKSYLLSGDSLTLTTKIKNAGKRLCAGAVLDVYRDLSRDSMAQTGELIASFPVRGLSSGELDSMQLPLGIPPPGDNLYIAILHFTADEDTTNNVALCPVKVIAPSENRNDIVINEIMYAPANNEPEWIEVYNRSTKTINVKKWQLVNGVLSVGALAITDVLIPPQSFMVFAKDTTLKSFYPYSISVHTASLPALHNSGDMLVLRDSLERTIDSVSYTPAMGGSSGYSLERVSVDSVSTGSNNWKQSLSRYHATPGTKNSVVPREYDAVNTSLFSLQPYSLAGEPVSLFCKISNRGKHSFAGVVLNLYDDGNFDSTAQAGEKISSFPVANLAAGDSITMELPLGVPTVGVHQYIAVVAFSQDEDTTNNTACCRLQVVVPTEVRNDIVINEVMYAPANNEPEWIEIFNRTNRTINLKKWQIANGSPESGVHSLTEVLLSPRSYLVLTKDSLLKSFYPFSFLIHPVGLPTLHNTGDELVLRDSLNRIIDSMQYTPAMGGSAGCSLERVSVDSGSTSLANWKQCISRFHGTPGINNSVTIKHNDAQLLSMASSNAWYYAGDTLTLFCIVKNLGRQSIQGAELYLYYDSNLDTVAQAGEKIAAFDVPVISPGDSAQFAINAGIVKNGLRQYLAVVHYPVDEDTTNNFAFCHVRGITAGEQRNDVVINEILYATLPGESEWIELYNQSNKTIDLKKYHLADAKDTATLLQNSFFLLPARYVLLSHDSLLAKKFSLSSPLLVVPFPVLNNDGDKVILMDSLFRVIDSLQYDGTWGVDGKSIERVASSASSTEQANWVVSKNKYGASPGAANSISSKTTDLMVSAIACTPQKPLAGDWVTPKALIKNLGAADATNCMVQFSLAGLVAADSILASVTVPLLHAKDSLMVSSTAAFKMNNTSVLYKATVSLANDEDTTNNYLPSMVSAKQKPPQLVLNEIMFSPPSGAPEWIELRNISGDRVNLKGCTVTDVLTAPQTTVIAVADYFVNPFDYVILSRDSLPAHFSYANSRLLKIALPPLNDDADGVIIRTGDGETIDSVFYASSWRTHQGRSLERISMYQPSTDSTNWIFSYAKNGATPALPNAVDTLARHAKNDLMVNEILYNAGADNSDFIELYNAGNKYIQLTGWSIMVAGKHRFYLCDTVAMLPSRQYYVLYADTVLLQKFPQIRSNVYSHCTMSDLALLTVGTWIVLQDGTGGVIDSLYYMPSWHSSAFKDTKNRSLEKLGNTMDSWNSHNWSSSLSADGATPGKENSIKTLAQPVASGLSFSPNPFSPDNDSFEDVTVISLTVQFAQASVTVTIYDDKGRQVRKLLNSEPMQIPALIPFDGRNEDRNPLRIGMYIVLAEAVDLASGRKEVHKGVLVVARKL